MLQYYDPDKHSLTGQQSDPNRDYGTPAISLNNEERVELVTLSIDGHSVTVPDGTSIMRAAAHLDINVPRLCATDSLQAFGSCRICLVQIEGRKGFPASCTTQVEEGMVVRTQSEAVAKLRRNVMELYISCLLYTSDAADE